MPSAQRVAAPRRADREITSQPSNSSAQHNSHDSRPGDQQRLWDFYSPEDEKTNQPDDGRWDVGDRSLCKNHRRAGNRARCRPRRAFHKSFEHGMLAMADDVATDKKDKEINRQKHRRGGKDRAPKSRDEIADKSRRDDDRPRGDDPNGDGVEKFAFGQPLIFDHDALMQK